MIPRLARDHEPAPKGGDLVDGWLRVFLSLLKLPHGQAAGIREELEGHLRERVRDLMVSGMGEGEATKQAISELGEAADVAARYRALRSEPRRRLAMHATLFTAAGAALALSIAAFNGGQPADRNLRQAVAERDAAIEQLRVATVTRAVQVMQPGAGGELADLRRDWDMHDQPVGDILALLAETLKAPLNVRWSLMQNGLQQDHSVSFKAKGADVPALMRAINESAGLSGGDAADVRLVSGVLEVATREYFDRREMELASYDLSGIIAARRATYDEPREKVVEEIVLLVQQFVSADDWRANGGDLADLSVVGDRAFVRAPARMHPQVKWILDQLPKQGDEVGAAPSKEIRVYPVKHALAQDLIEVLKRMQSIRSIDFNRVTYDASANSILCAATRAEHEKFLVALESLDRPAKTDRAPERGKEGEVAAPASSAVVYIDGEIARRGVYAMPDGEFTLRRLLAAAGGLPESATTVEICETRNGESKVMVEVGATDLRSGQGPDPVLKAGQRVSVR
jgi:hypothetical protein